METQSFSVGDAVVLAYPSTFPSAPRNSTGIITKLYYACGGPAAEIEWDTYEPENGMEVCVLLEELAHYQSQDIQESSESIDTLFGGMQ